MDRWPGCGSPHSTPVMAADTVALVTAHRAGTLGVWEVIDAEPGVGVSVRNRLVPSPDAGEATELYVYESDASHDLAPGRCVLAYLVHLDDVHVFGGLHDVLLEPPEIDEVLSAIVTGDGILAIRGHWLVAAEHFFDRLDAEDEAEDGNGIFAAEQEESDVRDR